MTTIKGKLEPFFETGTEGVVWSVFEDDKKGYDALHCLFQGDYLTILNPEDPTKVVWEGNINLEFERNYEKYPMNPDYGQQAIMGYWVHGIQAGVEPDDWGTWFFRQYPAELIKGEVGHLYQCKSSTISGYKWVGKGSPYNKTRDAADLIVKFKNGGIYRYKDVDYETYWAFEGAESKGKYFAKNIKDKFVTEKLDLPKPAKYSADMPGPWVFPTSKTHGKPHGSDVEAAWPFPTYNKP